MPRARALHVSVVRARPPERRAPLLDNPGKGCATFQRFAGDPTYPDERWSEEGPRAFPPRQGDVAPAYLPSAVAYCRWFWSVLEPAPGRYDFGMVDGALRTARARGQTLQVRLMPFGPRGQPQLPAWYIRRHGARRVSRALAAYGHLEPDYEGAAYLDRWGGLVAAFGRRFDGHPALESVDLAFLGPWGEGAGTMSRRRVDEFSDRYAAVHPRTPLLVNVDGPQFAAGVARGTGWRCDCFGDLRSTPSRRWRPGATGWNHTFDAYPQAVARAGASEVWKTRPVTLETCGTPLSWHRSGYDLSLIVAQGLKMHASVFMPKSCPIPREWLAPLAAFCDRLGYRFVLRQALWETPARRGAPLALRWWIENTGVAPVYRPCRLALRLSWGRRATVVPLRVDPRRWLPGDAWFEEEVTLPRDLPRGTHAIAAALVDDRNLRPVIRFANDGYQANGWLPLAPLVLR